MPALIVMAWLAVPVRVKVLAELMLPACATVMVPAPVPVAVVTSTFPVAKADWIELHVRVEVAWPATPSKTTGATKGAVGVMLILVPELSIVMLVGSSNKSPFCPLTAKVLTDPK